MNSLPLKSPAKINLTLQILNKREDGYHNLKSEFQTIDLHDKITLTKIPEGIQLVTSGNYKIPNNRDNLAYQAAEKLRSHAKGKVGIKIEIEKHIPLFAGLGGGSSNAATVIKGLNKLWELDLPLEKQIEIGKQIGADVPFFLHEGKCLIEGIGEKITPLESDEKEKFIIVAQLPYIKIPTPWAYEQWDKTENKPPNPLFKGEQKETENDFEKVVFPHFPDLKDLKETFLKEGAGKANMTGSGSAIYGIFEDRKVAEKCLEKIKDKCEFAWLGKFK